MSEETSRPGAGGREADAVREAAPEAAPATAPENAPETAPEVPRRAGSGTAPAAAVQGAGEVAGEVAGERGRYGRKRPRPGLTTAGVVAAGRRVIERDGIDALTMRAVATELGTAPASLYRHVTDREALLLAVLEEIAEGLPVGVSGAGPEARLLRRLVDAHDYMAGHAWVLHILIRGELVAENALPFNDACLADLMAAGLPPGRAMPAFRSCWQLVLGELLSEHPVSPPREPSQRRAAYEGADATRLPALGRVLAETGYVGVGERCGELEVALGALIAGLVRRG
ncbi:helix-turn-helix domain-containing protein [Kitasatospora sp. NPDC002965]|uniref:TetR/AcrR family transcriptional regulator n=1 Tax=Kitasatospora sp. NPDC002965 TaxID=3154775 RepID=UPI0033AAEC71